MKKLWIRLTDNSFWYVGYTSTEMGDKQCDKAFCLIVRNPFDRSWKEWEATRLAHKERKAWAEAAIKRLDIPVGVDPDKAHLFDGPVKTLEDKDKT